jgi:predicted secreted protein
MKYVHKLLFVMLLLSTSACYAGTPIKAGQWNLQTPAGDVTSVTVTLLRKNEYYFYAPQHPISGVYTWDGKLFRITKPDNPRMGGFVWRLQRDHTLAMVEETPVPISGMKLISSKMWRLTD